MQRPRRISLFVRATTPLRLGMVAMPLMIGCGHDALRLADSAPGAEPYGIVAAPAVVVAPPSAALEPNHLQKAAAVEALKVEAQKAAPPPAPIVSRSKSPVSAVNEDEATVRYVGEKACLVHFAGATTLFHANGLTHLLKTPAKVGKGKAARQAAPTLQLPDEDIDIVAIGSQSEIDVSRAIALALYRQYKPVFLVPAGGKIKAQLARFGIPRANIHEQTPYSEASTGHGHVMASLIPAPKAPVKKGKKAKPAPMPVGYVLSDGHRRVYFAGDGGFGDQYEQVHNRFGAPDVSVLNIAASTSTLHLRAMPMSAEQAHKAQVLLNSPVTVSLPQAPTYHAPEQDQGAASTCLITPLGDETVRIAMGRIGPCEAAPLKAQSNMPTSAQSPDAPAPTEPSQPTPPQPDPNAPVVPPSAPTPAPSPAPTTPAPGTAPAPGTTP